MKEYCFYGWESASMTDVRGLTPRDYYDILSEIWCADTCAPRMRGEWTPENKTLGQCSITAFLMQEIYGGRVCGVPLKDGNFHCFNIVGDCVFDLTSEQFKNTVLNYDGCPEQIRSEHFKKEEKRERFCCLRERLATAVCPPLETERLILRPWRLFDAGDCFRYASDPDVGPAAGWLPHTDVGLTRKIIKDILAVPETYAIVFRETGEVIGSVSLMFDRDSCNIVKKDECELGYWIGKPFWGRGIMTEAAREMLRHGFEDLNMRVIFAAYFEGNERSKRVQEKCGFVFSSVRKRENEVVVFENRLTREEWKANSPGE